jgi:hypothetical protein
MRERPDTRLVAYGVAVLAIVVSLLLRLPLHALVGYHTPFLTFVPAVCISAYLGGLGPGLLATFRGLFLDRTDLLVWNQQRARRLRYRVVFDDRRCH